MSLSRKEKLIAIILSLLLVATIAAGYFLYLQPKKAEVERTEKELQMEEQLLTVIQGKVMAASTTTFESTVELQKQVPVKPLLSKLLLDIEKAEIISESFVTNMSFTDGEITIENISEIEEKVEEDLNGDTTGNGESTEGTESTDTGQADASPKENTIPLPTGVKKITVNLSVESPTYFELEKFIETLEDNLRIVVVESIEFNGYEEIIKLEQQIEPLSYNLAVSAFYMPTLLDLQNQLPIIEVPIPSNKKNPLNTFPDLKDEEKDMNASSETTN
jgi:type IV pilus assembly protein PilO